MFLPPRGHHQDDIQNKLGSPHFIRKGKGKAIPLQACTGAEGSSQVSRQSAHEGGKVVSPTHRPPLPPKNYTRYLFMLQAEPTPVRPEGLCQ